MCGTPFADCYKANDAGLSLVVSRRWHSLGIAFPQRTEARGEATVRLEYVGPPE